MAANLTVGIPPQPVGAPFTQVSLPVENETQLWQGGMLSLAPDGGLVPATTAGAGHVVGVSQWDSAPVSGTGTNRMLLMTEGTFCWQNGVNAVSDSTPFGTVLYAETDNTVGTGEGGETVIAGRFFGFEDDGRVKVFVTPNASWFDGNSAFAGGAGSALYKARLVMTSLAAYSGSTTGVLTASANGALANQDGVAPAVGDVLLIQEGTTNISAASDAGPYVVQSLGGAAAKWILARPTWWATGSAIVLGQTIDVGGEGSVYAGTSWRSFAAKGAVVDTNDPDLWVSRVTQQISLVAGTKTISNVGVRSASQTQVTTTRVVSSGTVNSTIMYGPSSGAATGITQGAINTGSVVIDAQVAAGTIADADTSTLNVTIQNW